MTAQILGPCPRGCGGTIMASDGVCLLCSRSVGEPVVETKPSRALVRESFPDWSAKCNMREHDDCGGRRLDRDALYGEKFPPCACPCHRESAETKPRLPRANNGPDGEARWVALRPTGGRRSAHLLLDASLVGDPPMFNVPACRQWFPASDLQAAPESLPRCKRCEAATGKQ